MYCIVLYCSAICFTCIKCNCTLRLLKYMTGCFILCSLSYFRWENTSYECAMKAKVPYGLIHK